MLNGVMVNGIMLSVVMLSVCPYAEDRFAECRYAECRGAHYAAHPMCMLQALYYPEKQPENRYSIDIMGSFFQQKKCFCLFFSEKFLKINCRENECNSQNFLRTSFEYN